MTLAMLLALRSQTAESRQRIEARKFADPQHAKGSFTYSLADYDFDEASLERDSASYQGLMQRLFG